MSAHIIILQLIFITSLLFVAHGEHGFCQPPGTVWQEEGTKYTSLYTRGELYAYTLCEVGFTITSTIKVRCANGLWESPLPRCARVLSKQCEHLRIPRNAIRNCDRGAPSIGKACHFRCREPYTLKGSRDRYCLSNLQWSGVTPQCVLNHDIYGKAHAVVPDPVPNYSRYNERQKKFSSSTESPRSCDINNGGCEHYCQMFNGFPSCSCKNGYRSSHNGRCFDVDECQEQIHYCSHKCINTPGSYECRCRLGYKLKDTYYCEDVNECLFKVLNQCNQKCINNQGSYTCSCEAGYVLKNEHECEGCRMNSYRSDTDNVCIECPLNSVTNSTAKSSIADCHCLSGYSGDPSRNIPCIDINECLTDNFGCSHFCINTPGSALCSCPMGFELKNDNKTCVDRDECSIKNGGCEMFCHNSIGSFHCSCSIGYRLAEDKYSCADEDECVANNGGCSDICNNFPGGYYCSCPTGFRLDVEGKTCSAARCLSVAVPHHSTLRCKGVNKTKVTLRPHDDSPLNPPDYPFGTICKVKCNKGFNITTPDDAITCLEDGNWNSTAPQCIASHCASLKIPENGSVYPPVCTEEFVPIQQQCYFTCNPGYEIYGGKSIIKCKNNVTWSSDTPSCRPVHSVPSIICPDDIIVDLRWNESYANVFIAQPITNMETVEIYPEWIMLDQPIPFPSGQTNVLFKVTNLDSNATSQCIITVNVVDKQPPVFITCPESFSVSDVGYEGVIVTWNEPIASDNVAIESVIKNLEPSSKLNPGVHFVEYIAKDAAGNSGTCAFQINITRGHCNDLNDPINGKAICMDWLTGRLCRAVCDPGYSRDPDEPNFFACGDSRKWTPTEIISPCLPICLDEKIWSPISESCEEKEEFGASFVQ